MNVVVHLLSAVSPLPDGDYIDRLSYCYSAVALVVTSAFISGWSFVGSPIQCWFPAYYKGWWMEYALDYCYVQNTYFVPFAEQAVHNHFDFGVHMVEIPKNLTERDERQIGYYQWVPFLLALQAILFYLPVVIWRSIYESSGFKIKAICDTCSISSNMEEGDRQKNMNIVAAFLTQENTIAESLGGKFRKIGDGSFIVAAYLFTKLLFALNAVLQLWLLKIFLGVDGWGWGWQVATDLMAGREWPETGHFPRVTLCDFAVRVLGNLHRHSVQCVLMINMFNEKIFVVLWFWLCFMVAISVYSLINWTVSTVLGQGRSAVSRYMRDIHPNRAHYFDQFITQRLRSDGVFVVRLVALNSGDTVAAALVRTVWEDFCQQKDRNLPPYVEPLLIADKGHDNL